MGMGSRSIPGIRWVPPRDGAAQGTGQPRAAFPSSGAFWEGICGPMGSRAWTAPGRSGGCCGQPGTGEKVSPPRRQLGLSRCQGAAPHGSRAMGKGKLALDKAISATTGPMGSRPVPLSQPRCPKDTHRALPTCPLRGVPLRHDHSSQTRTFLGHGKSSPSCVGSLAGAAASLRALRLLGCSRASGHYSFVLKPCQPGSA